MSIETLKNKLPDYAKDLKLNLGAIMENDVLAKTQIMGCALASAIASRHAGVLKAVMAEAAPHLDDKNRDGAKAAAAIMGMNNIYYRFFHLTNNEEYRTMPAGLRMNIIKGHGIDEVDWELYTLAVSVINACKGCVTAHEKNLRQHGISAKQVQEVVKIAAVVHAVAVTIEAEETLSAAAKKAA